MELTEQKTKRSLDFEVRYKLLGDAHLDEVVIRITGSSRQDISPKVMVVRGNYDDVPAKLIPKIQQTLKNLFENPQSPVYLKSPTQRYSELAVSNAI